MAGIFHHLGSETHLFIHHEKFLHTFDPMIQDKIVSEHERQGIIVHRNSSQSKVEKTEKGLKLHYSDSSTKEETLDLNCLFWAIGRAPEVEDLGLDKAGVKQNERSQIIADEYQNTNVENIYSLGDVCGKIELTPVAIAAGLLLSNRLFGGPDYKNAKVFAHSEVDSIGMTQPAAREKYGDKGKVYNTSLRLCVMQ
ncbi:hypothetical protein ABVK25_004340 [Lepraria finkii]|uniref:FAD/NAD(P)-binding domain-containing protein n=1 Tax=Lepraria finkii TaxID=1340010 RepID=A0ABR4BDK9_9LECA